MRLALVTHNVFGGDGQSRVNAEIARHALAAGHEVLLLADRVAPELTAAGVEWVPVHPRPARPHLAKVVAFARAADRALDRLAADGRRPDRVLANGVSLTRPHHLNAVHFVHGTWAREPLAAAEFRQGWRGRYQQVYTAVNAHLEARVLRRAEAIVAVSDLVRDQLAVLGVAAEVIPNGVDEAPGAAEAVGRAELGLPEGVPLALFVGDLRTRRKNLDTVLAALAEVPDLHLAVAGRLEGSPFPALAERLGVRRRVHFLGFRDDVPALLAASDLFVLPSRVESFSLVLLEAMAAGRAVVTARTVGASMLLAPETGVVLDDPEDAAALAEALRRLIAEPDARESMGAAAREVARSYSWGRMAGSYLDRLGMVGCL